MSSPETNIYASLTKLQIGHLISESKGKWLAYQQMYLAAKHTGITSRITMMEQKYLTERKHYQELISWYNLKS